MEFLSVNSFERYLDREKPLVQGMLSAADQIQPNGIELTLAQVSRFKDAGRVSVSNKNRRPSDTETIQFDENGAIFCSPGCYLVTFNEITNIPGDVFAIARVRSTLLRSGATIETALWDSGYCGRSSALLLVHNPAGIWLEKNSRLIQLVFFGLGEEVKKTYSGRYQHENTASK